LVLQVVGFAPHVLMGGGQLFMLPPGRGEGQRSDGRDLVEELKGNGYRVVYDRSELMAFTGQEHLLGLFDAGGMAHEIDRASTQQPSLSEMVAVALRVLSRNPRGFVLLVDAGTIDWALHDRDLGAALRDVLALDEAVDVALRFQQLHKDTLIVVAGDHETGGLSFPKGFDLTSLSGQQRSVLSLVDSLSTDQLDPNNSIFLQAIREQLGVAPDVPARERLKLAQRDPQEVAQVLADMLLARTGAVIPTSEHTALPPLLWARGPAQHLFAGAYDITDVHRKLRAAMRLME